MQYEEKLKLIKTIGLLGHMPERQLAGIAQVLKPKELSDGAAVFEEGSMGMSLYFIATGRIRIAKRAAAGGYTDLAVLSAGDFFGESALVEEAFRSASAIASGPCILFELFRGDLGRWTQSNPQQAVQFFADLVNLQSRRLRRTSDELTLHCDLAESLADAKITPKAFLEKALERTTAHLDGGWSAAAYLRAEQAAVQGSFDFAELARKAEAAESAWVDDATFQVALTDRDGRVGRLLFHAKSPVHDSQKEDFARTFSGISRLVLNALETIKLRGLN